MTRKDVEGAILSTLVIKNRQSLSYAIDNIMKLAEDDKGEAKKAVAIVEFSGNDRISQLKKHIEMLKGGVQEIMDDSDEGTKSFCKKLLDTSED